MSGLRIERANNTPNAGASPVPVMALALTISAIASEILGKLGYLLGQELGETMGRVLAVLLTPRIVGAKSENSLAHLVAAVGACLALFLERGLHIEA